MTPEKLVAKIRQVFPDAAHADIQRQLDEYDGPDRLRVQLAIVKLSDEDERDTPRHYLDAARKDYRDVLAWAEFPQQLRPDWFSLSVTERAKVTKADRQQYVRWLAR
jgi:hypothetical protein